MSDPCFGVAGKCRHPLLLFLKTLDIRTNCVYTMYIHTRRTFTYDCKTSKMGK